MTDEIRIVEWLPIDPDTLYRVWLDSSEHSAFTGAKAEIEPAVGGKHSAWDGYIQGVILALEPGTRIVQSWRSSEFPEGAPESRVEVRFLPEDGGTRLEIHQTDLPGGDKAKYEAGWNDFYVKPLRKKYGKDEAAQTQKSAPPQAPTKKAAPTKVTAKQPAKKAATAVAQKTGKTKSAKTQAAPKKVAKKVAKKKAPAKKVANKAHKKKAAKKKAKRHK